MTVYETRSIVIDITTAATMKRCVESSTTTVQAPPKRFKLDSSDSSSSEFDGSKQSTPATTPMPHQSRSRFTGGVGLTHRHQSIVNSSSSSSSDNSISDASNDAPPRCLGVKLEHAIKIKTEPPSNDDDDDATTTTATAKESKCVVEYETYFALPISTHVGDTIKSSIPKSEMSAREVWVFYFNDGSRVTGTTSQRKIIKSKARHLYLAGTLAEPIMIPMCRTISIEESAPLDAPLEDLTSTVQRFVLYKQNSVRICLECRSNGNGHEYYISGEVEYPCEVARDFHALRIRENELVYELKDTLSQLFDSSQVQNIMCVTHRVNSATHDSVFRMPCRVFNKFHKIQISDTKEFVYKHKFDGFKGKMVCVAPNKVLYQDDNIKFGSFNSSIFNTVPNLYFQIENMCSAGRKSKESLMLMKKRNGTTASSVATSSSAASASTRSGGCGNKVANEDSSQSSSTSSIDQIPAIIITDILGVRMGGQLFMPEPLDVLRFLSTFNRHHQFVNFGDGCKRVLVQQAVSVNSTTKFKRDGLIVIYRNKEFKFKFPTFDVKMLNGKCYVKNSNNMDDSLNLEYYENMPDGIYEVSFSNLQAGTSNMCNYLTFLRLRTDRMTPSTRLEVEEAIHELDLMIGCVLKN